MSMILGHRGIVRLCFVQLLQECKSCKRVEANCTDKQIKLMILIIVVHPYNMTLCRSLTETEHIQYNNVSKIFNISYRRRYLWACSTWWKILVVGAWNWEIITAPLSSQTLDGKRWLPDWERWKISTFYDNVHIVSCQDCQGMSRNAEFSVN